MSGEQTTTTAGLYPANWHIAKDFDPQDHMLNLKGKDYLGVQHRLLWFIRDQRAFISSGLATMPYIVRTEAVEMDTDKGYAHFKTYVRDVLGNEATMYGSETAKDFGDYAEKASTKSLGRALLALGYGTAFAPEMDEGERVVDSPQERRQSSRQAAQQQRQRSAPAPRHDPEARDFESAPEDGSGGATTAQLNAITKLCAALGEPVPTDITSYVDARQRIAGLSERYKQVRRAS